MPLFYWVHPVCCWSLSFRLSQYYSFFQKAPSSDDVIVCEKDLGWWNKGMLPREWSGKRQHSLRLDKELGKRLRTDHPGCKRDGRIGLSVKWDITRPQLAILLLHLHELLASSWLESTQMIILLLWDAVTVVNVCWLQSIWMAVLWLCKYKRIGHSHNFQQSLNEAVGKQGLTVLISLGYSLVFPIIQLASAKISPLSQPFLKLVWNLALLFPCKTLISLLYDPKHYFASMYN